VSSGNEEEASFSPWGLSSHAIDHLHGAGSMPLIQPITMPKWGLAMEEGQVAKWAVEEGESISQGQEIMDIETTKITNSFESPVAGVLRRKVVGEGETVPVGALLGIVSEPDVSEADVAAFVEAFLGSFKPAEKSDASGLQPEAVEVGGRRIRYLRAGPDIGSPILLVHGFGADITSWMFNQAVLAEQRPVYALDLPGHGGSGKDVAGGSTASLAGAVRDFMAAVGIRKAHLVGHSLGGAVALRVALDSPGGVAALTLIAPTGLGKEISRDFIEGFIREDRGRKLRPVLEMLVANPAMITADMVEEVLKFKRLDGAVAALRAVADANFDAGSQKVSLREWLVEIKVPVQVIWGEDDSILPAAHAEGLPSFVLVHRIAAAGHLPHMEKAVEVNALITGLG
jgi:pyruvate dehydrogenase E2 component (dihydrolipoamide acetyltransferase)